MCVFVFLFFHLFSMWCVSLFLSPCLFSFCISLCLVDVCLSVFPPILCHSLRLRHKFFCGVRLQWGNVDYVKSLRQAFDAAGFNNTKIVGADGSIPADQIAALQTDPEFSAAEPILGL